MKLLFSIFITFAKVGALTFGGGYSMLPLVQREVIEKKHWATEEDVMDYYAVSQCLPGLIAVNTALLIGYKKKGVLGGIAAALGVVFPSLVIILVIAMFLQNAFNYPLVQKAFAGVRVVVCALIMQAIVKLWKTALRGWFGYAVYLAALAVALFAGVNIIFIILASVALGIGYAVFLRGKGAAG